MNSITFIVTDKCNIRCKFCGPDCGPQYKTYLTSENMNKIFSEVSSKIPVPLVVFTGGEPMLFSKELCKSLNYIKLSKSRSVTRVVTNAFWASSPTSAISALNKLKNAGLAELNISVDDFHQEFVPIENVKNAVNAAIKLEIRVLLAHKSYPSSISNKAYYEDCLGMSIEQVNKNKSNNFNENKVFFSQSYTVPIGRGSDEINKDKWLPPNYTKDRWEGPCSEVLKSYTISPNGNLMPCCGLVNRDIGIFYAGNVLNNNIVSEMEKYCKSILYNWLALEGPSEIRKFVIEKDPKITFSDKYVQNCQVCQELFSNERVLHIINSNSDAIGYKLTLLRCLLDANRDKLIRRINEMSASEYTHKNQKANKANSADAKSRAAD